jgi:hypothetical protein
MIFTTRHHLRHHQTSGWSQGRYIGEGKRLWRAGARWRGGRSSAVATAWRHHAGKLVKRLWGCHSDPLNVTSIQYPQSTYFTIHLLTCALAPPTFVSQRTRTEQPQASLQSPRMHNHQPSTINHQPIRPSSTRQRTPPVRVRQHDCTVPDSFKGAFKWPLARGGSLPPPRDPAELRYSGESRHYEGPCSCPLLVATDTAPPLGDPPELQCREESHLR